MDTKLTILLVEDDQTTCTEFINYIDELEDILLVDVTNDSNKAIEIIQDKLPTVIILDLELHNGSGSGLNLLHELKQVDLPIIPYILVTTNNISQLTYDSVRQLGADFIMGKYQADYSIKGVIDFLKIMAPAIHKKNASTSHDQAITEAPAVKHKRLKARINSEINIIGISPKLIGHQYLQDAIFLTITDPEKNINLEVSDKYKKSKQSVERAMQNAINKAWKTNDIEILLNYYTARIRADKGVPTIQEFISYYASKIKNEFL